MQASLIKSGPGSFTICLPSGKRSATRLPTRSFCIPRHAQATFFSEHLDISGAIAWKRLHQQLHQAESLQIDRLLSN